MTKLYGNLILMATAHMVRFHARVVIGREQSRLSDEQILELHFGLTKGRLP
jgi:hypothetical protein